jgi:single-strand DNA-binding protein
VLRSVITLFGNVANDLTLRQTAGGAVANFRLAVNEGWFDKKSQTWQNRTVYLNVSCWRQLAEHVGSSLALGQPVIVVGRLKQRSYEKDGVTHWVTEVDADTVGHDLSFGAASFVRTPRGPQTSEVVDAEPVVVAA